MSRIATPAEKVSAVAGIYFSLWEEIVGDPMTPGIDKAFNATLLDIAGRIAMGTDTRDLGLMARRERMKAWTAKRPDWGPILQPNDPLTPCDDCGRTDGTHDPEVEH